MKEEELKESQESPKDEISEALKAEAQKAESQLESAIKKIKENVTEEDPAPSPTLTLRKILGGDILNAQLVRSQMGIFIIIVLFTIFYVAVRYQCQKDMIAITRLEEQLKDAKYKALSSTSALTERCRESHVLDVLRSNKDSLLHIADQPPYIINVPEE